MPGDALAELDRLLESDNPAAGLDFLMEEYRSAREYGLLFEARLMKRRLELGLPLVQTEAFPQSEYQQTVVEAAREAGTLFLADGRIERAWPYFRAIAEPEPVADAIAAMEPGENQDGVIGIAFQEGVHPLKGLELILANHGICRAITSFGMQAVAKDRDKCIALLAQTLHAEVAARIGAAIEAREGPRPENTNLMELMEGRGWLFGEWDYYVDTSHLLSVVPYGIEVTDPAVLGVFYELCEYGRRLAPQFQSPGAPPFEDPFTAYGHYVKALLGRDAEEHIGYFRRKVEEADPEVAGDAPGRTLVNLLVALDRPAEALDALLEHVMEDAPYGLPAPSALQLCYRAGDFARMKNLAHERGDLLSYAAGSILSRNGKTE